MRYFFQLDQHHQNDQRIRLQMTGWQLSPVTTSPALSSTLPYPRVLKLSLLYCLFGLADHAGLFDTKNYRKRRLKHVTLSTRFKAFPCIGLLVIWFG